MFLAPATTDPTIPTIQGLASGLNSRSPYTVIPYTHEVILNSGTSDKTYYFGAHRSLTPNETAGEDVYFQVPYDCVVKGIDLTINVNSLPVGSQTGPNTPLGIQNNVTGEFFNLRVEPRYSQKINRVRYFALNTVLSASEKYHFRVVVPGYSTSNASGIVHEIKLYVEIKYPSVIYLGKEDGDAAFQWKNGSIQKKFALYAPGYSVNTYGLSGYYAFRPIYRTGYTPGSFSSNNSGDFPNIVINEPAMRVGDLGISASSYPTRYQQPFLFEKNGNSIPSSGNMNFDTIYGFVENRTIATNVAGGDNATEVNYPGYPIVPANQLYPYADVRLGATSVGCTNGPYNTPDGVNDGYYGTVLSFKVGSFGSNPDPQFGWWFWSIRIGLLVDSVNDPVYAPTYVSLASIVSKSVFSEKLVPNGIPKLVFFDIIGVPDTSFTVNLWRPSPGVSALSTITFDGLGS
jgi:hypothetical protein